MTTSKPDSTGLNLRQPYKQERRRAAEETVCLPVCLGIRRAPKIASRADFPDWSDMRLLIVEDNEELAELLAKGLRTAGYESDTLSSIEEARSVLETTFYAALILDLGLPDGDGLELLRDLRHRNNPIPVLVLTARGGLHDRVHGLRSGADDYLVKPFAFSELLARVRSLLRRTPLRPQNTICMADLEIDLLRHRATRAGQRLAAQ